MAERNGKRWPAPADTRNASCPGDESQIEDQGLPHESDWEEGRRGRETQREKERLPLHSACQASVFDFGRD